MITTSTPLVASGKGRLLTLWILSALVALTFVGAGAAKLAGAAVMVDLFAKVGLGQWFRYVTGLLEVAAGIGLLNRNPCISSQLLSRRNCTWLSVSTPSAITLRLSF